MLVSLIAALGRQRQIGYNSQIPWSLPADLRNFSRLTLGHHLIFGRKTYDSIGYPLHGRHMIVLSHNPSLSIPGIQVATDIKQALSLAQAAGESECFIGGGSQLYADAAPLAHRMYLSRVDYSGPADVYFPDLDFTSWKITESKFFEATDKTPAWTYEVYDRCE